MEWSNERGEAMPDDLPPYGPGDTIRLELDLQDDSGVGEVYAHFVHEAVSGGGGERDYVSSSGEGSGKIEKTMLIRGMVGDNTLAGEYRCIEIRATDVLSNEKWHHPEIRFRIEAPPTDAKGPEIAGWRFPKAS
jgi:hypothetical protein